MHRGPSSLARLQTLTYHLCVELLPPLVYYIYIWQDVSLHFAFVLYTQRHNPNLDTYSLQFIFTINLSIISSRYLLVTEEDPWLQACPDLHIFDCKTLLVLLAPSRMSLQRVVCRNTVSRFSSLSSVLLPLRLVFTSRSLVSVS